MKISFAWPLSSPSRGLISLPRTPAVSRSILALLHTFPRLKIKLVKSLGLYCRKEQDATGQLSSLDIQLRLQHQRLDVRPNLVRFFAHTTRVPSGTSLSRSQVAGENCTSTASYVEDGRLFCKVLEWTSLLVQAGSNDSPISLLVDDLTLNFIAPTRLNHEADLMAMLKSRAASKVLLSLHQTIDQAALAKLAFSLLVNTIYLQSQHETNSPPRCC